jgi:antitoxin component of MazEF toxin-antitoxin module/predicted HTH transcriptional regulator
MNTGPTPSVDWSKIVYRNFESKELDYKGPCAWDENDKKACCELVKDVLALANTTGGWIVVGVKEAKTGFVHEGLTEQQAQSFDTSRLNRFVQNYADPPINSHVHKAPLDGRIFVVIEVPPFPDAPHVCQKDYPGVLAACAIYVRTDNNESAPLKNTSDFRVLVERAVRNRSEQLLTSIRTILTNGLRPPEPADAEKYEKQIAVANKRCDELNTTMKANIRRWGHSLAVRIPKALAQEASFNEGDELDVRAEQGRIVVQRSQGKRYRLSDLMASVTKVNRHAEMRW